MNRPHFITKAALLLLSLSLCASEAYYSIQREGGNVTVSFPEPPVLGYHEQLAQAGRTWRKISESSPDEQNIGAPKDIIGLLSKYQYFLTKILSSVQPIGQTFPGNGYDGEDDSEEKMAINLIMTSLDNLAQAGDVTSRCVNDTGFLLLNILQRQGWALKFLDATGKPGAGLSELHLNLVGDYGLCRKQVSNGSETTFRGNYVTWRVPFGPINPINPGASLMLQWGVCMPDTCSDTENTLFVIEVLQLAGLNGTFTAFPAESHTEHREATTATVFAIMIICIFGVLMLAGTVYDVVFLQWPVWKEKWLEQEEKKNMGMVADVDAATSRNDDDEPLILEADIQRAQFTPTGKLVKALVAFSVYTNGSKVLSTTQQPGSISCIHGIRFFSMTWVILGHVFSFCPAFVDNTFTEVPVFLQRWSFDAIANGTISVDSFFTLSGLLVSYITVSEMKKTGWKLNWGLFYFHRFWRLTPPYMLVMVLVLGLQQYCGEGPLWESVQPSDKAFCEKYWWTNLLYINNIVHSDALCLPQSWYLSNDMQFHLVAPLMIIPFYFDKFLGFASCGIFFLTHAITTGVLSVHHKWTPTFVSATPNPAIISYLQDYYLVPWCRIGPYIVGILTGYIIAAHRDRLRLNWPKATIGWTVATAVALAVIYGIHGDIGGKHPSSVGVAALYNSMARSAWGACVCWVIVACVAGWGGFVNTFLSWSPFVVLGRLTYMAYLIHLALLFIFLGNQQTLLHISTLNISLIFMGLLVAVYCVSFVLMLALESPMVGLEKVLLPRRKKE